MIRYDLIMLLVYLCGIIGFIGVVFGIYQENVLMGFSGGVIAFSCLVVIAISDSVDKDTIRHIFYNSKLQSCRSVKEMSEN